jgi:hypothetical protein
MVPAATTTSAPATPTGLDLTAAPKHAPTLMELNVPAVAYATVVRGNVPAPMDTVAKRASAPSARTTVPATETATHLPVYANALVDSLETIAPRGCVQRETIP